MRQSNGRLRRRFDLRGQVQGVGFRPFVYGLASRLGLGGFVANNGLGAVVEVEGPHDVVETFEQRLASRLPPLARLTHCARRDLPPQNEAHFAIRPSSDDRSARPEVAPDAATCRDCLRELLSEGDRRRRYPFINCTNCGPRYSIIRDVPYDRPLTSMAAFEMCPDCRAEYENPADRRFHAQPNACPRCGPRLMLLPTGSDPSRSDPSRSGTSRSDPSRDREGAVATDMPAISAAMQSARDLRPLSARRRADPLRTAASLLRRGRIVAIKGLGGYHLACRAD
ncbi:MAG: carbamoyltransferase HypF, partial [Phycisphaerae bacterium]|nr:carbamoyltransferase HypF [Phycisphaerae bacterium]